MFFIYIFGQNIRFSGSDYNDSTPPGERGQVPIAYREARIQYFQRRRDNFLSRKKHRLESRVLIEL